MKSDWENFSENLLRVGSIRGGAVVWDALPHGEAIS